MEIRDLRRANQFAIMTCVVTSTIRYMSMDREDRLGDPLSAPNFHFFGILVFLVLVAIYLDWVKKYE